MRALLIAFASWVAALSACQPASAPVGQARSALDGSEATVRLDELEAAPFAEAVVEARGPWGASEGAFHRENEGADVGPMAIATDRQGRVLVLDTVGARLYRFGPHGERLTVPTGVRTADDLAPLSDGSVALLAYRRAPGRPGYDLLTVDVNGHQLSRRPVPAAATMPTALFADGGRLLVESRHGWLHASDGSPRLWGRPAGEVAVRAHRGEDGSVVLEAHTRQGERAWQHVLRAPWPITEVLAIETSREHVALVVRRIDESSVGPDEPAEHETWLVAVEPVTGAPLGRLRLVDSRVSHAGQPFAVAPSGDFFELVTSEEGVTVLRYRFLGGRP